MKLMKQNRLIISDSYKLLTIGQSNYGLKKSRKNQKEKFDLVI